MKYKNKIPLQNNILLTLFYLILNFIFSIKSLPVLFQSAQIQKIH